MLKRKQKINIIIASALIIIFAVLSILSLIIFRPKEFSFINFLHHNYKSASIVVKVEAAGKKAEPEKTTPIANQAASTTKSASNSIYLPILLYHKTPDNFEAQMQHLKDTGYTPVTMQELVAILNKQIKGPSKPIAITFDDGFSGQLKAIDILKKFNYKSTFYIIVGGKASNYCIGAERKAENHCGDSYLSWNEIINLSNSGLVEIGSHTIDHLQLSGLSESNQKFQIFESKKILENKLGKPVLSFAYPYGKFNQISINLVRQAGYNNATGVNGSEFQSLDGIFTLNRIRDTKDLK